MKRGLGRTQLLFIDMQITLKAKLKETIASFQSKQLNQYHEKYRVLSVLVTEKFSIPQSHRFFWK